jgi:hypothetical protein
MESEPDDPNRSLVTDSERFQCFIFRSYHGWDFGCSEMDHIMRHLDLHHPGDLIWEWQLNGTEKQLSSQNGFSEFDSGRIREKVPDLSPILYKRSYHSRKHVQSPFHLKSERRYGTNRFHELLIEKTIDSADLHQANAWSWNQRVWVNHCRLMTGSCLVLSLHRDIVIISFTLSFCPTKWHLHSP